MPGKCNPSISNDAFDPVLVLGGQLTVLIVVLSLLVLIVVLSLLVLIVMLLSCKECDE